HPVELGLQFLIAFLRHRYSVTGHPDLLPIPTQSHLMHPQVDYPKHASRSDVWHAPIEDSDLRSTKRVRRHSRRSRTARRDCRPQYMTCRFQELKETRQPPSATVTTPLDRDRGSKKKTRLGRARCRAQPFLTIDQA